MLSKSSLKRARFTQANARLALPRVNPLITSTGKFAAPCGPDAPTYETPEKFRAFAIELQWPSPNSPREQAAFADLVAFRNEEFESHFNPERRHAKP